MLVTMMVIATFGQLKPDTVMDARMHDAQFYRRVQEAKAQADQWAFKKSLELFPNSEIAAVARRDPAASRRLMMSRTAAKPALKSQAYRQIMQAYDISEKEFVRMVSDHRVRSLPHIPEGDVWSKDRSPIKMAVDHWGLVYTRFDPSQVKIPPKLARRIRHENPEMSDAEKLKKYTEESKSQKPGTHGETLTPKGP